MVYNWYAITRESLLGLWHDFLIFTPKLIVAIIVFIIGWWISVWLGNITARILEKSGFENLFKKDEWKDALKKADFKIKVSEYIGDIVKWVLGIISLLIAVKILIGSQYGGFLSRLVNWLPNLIAAIVIFIIAAVVADLLNKFIKAFLARIHVEYLGFVEGIVEGSIWTFAILMILSQLGVAPDIIRILVSGLVALIVLSLSLAIGLGAKDFVHDFLEDLKNRYKK